MFRSINSSHLPISLAVGVCGHAHVSTIAGFHDSGLIGQYVCGQPFRELSVVVYNGCNSLHTAGWWGRWKNIQGNRIARKVTHAEDTNENA